MKKTIILIALFISVLLVKAQQHDPKFNFNYVTYVNSSTPYNPNDATDNAHFTGYFDLNFNYFVFFPNGDCSNAYSFPEFAYIDGDTRLKMRAKYDTSLRLFVIWPVNPLLINKKDKTTLFRPVDALRYRKNKAGDVGILSVH